jgi:hypothetical protein
MAMWEQVEFSKVQELKRGTYLRISENRDQKFWNEVEGIVRDEWFTEHDVPTNYLVINVAGQFIDHKIHLIPEFETKAVYEIKG